LDTTLEIAVFASGRGSNFKAVLEKIRSGIITRARIAIVISNSSSAGALEIARENSIPTLHISRAQFTSDEEFTHALLSALHAHSVNFILLAGYMKMMPKEIIQHYRHRIINIHPALLPSFGGKGMFGHHVHEAVLAYGAKVSGATVHIVDEEYDRGPVVLQRCVTVEDDDTPESLAGKVLRIEHEIFPEAVRLFSEEKIEVRDRKVFIHNAPGRTTHPVVHP
jgi:phosphoribosylglycinamide formyltransferase-1